MLMNNRINFN